MQGEMIVWKRWWHKMPKWWGDATNEWRVWEIHGKRICVCEHTSLLLHMDFSGAILWSSNPSSADETASSHTQKHIQNPPSNSIHCANCILLLFIVSLCCHHCYCCCFLPVVACLCLVRKCKWHTHTANATAMLGGRQIGAKALLSPSLSPLCHVCMSLQSGGGRKRWNYCSSVFGCLACQRHQSKLLCRNLSSFSFRPASQRQTLTIPRCHRINQPAEITNEAVCLRRRFCSFIHYPLPIIIIIAFRCFCAIPPTLA